MDGSGLVKLLEPMNCFRCNSSPDDNVGKSSRSLSRKFGQHELKVEVIHDGKGGIKEFLAIGVKNNFAGILRPPYRFPGYTQLADYQRNGIPLSEVCNDCETRWGGRLYVKPIIGDDDVCITESIVIPLPDEGIDNLAFKLALAQSNSALYSFSTSEGRIRIVPELQAAVALYSRGSLDFKLQYQNSTSALNLTRRNDIPVAKVLELLDKKLHHLGEPLTYDNELANSVADYDLQEQRASLASAALRSVLVILHRYDAKVALELMDMCGIDPKIFEQDISSGSWFFVPEDKMTDRDHFFSAAGSIGGPNMFLHHLKKLDNKE